MTKERVYKTMALSLTMFGAKAWDINSKNRNKLLAVEMDYLRRSCRRTKLDRISNETIREITDIKKDI
jgi:hypothetical protein